MLGATKRVWAAAFFYIHLIQQLKLFISFSSSQCQSQLPATGVPVTRQRVDKMREMFNEYVKNRTLLNWKFYIVSFSSKS